MVLAAAAFWLGLVVLLALVNLMVTLLFLRGGGGRVLVVAVRLDPGGQHRPHHHSRLLTSTSCIHSTPQRWQPSHPTILRTLVNTR